MPHRLTRLAISLIACTPLVLASACSDDGGEDPATTTTAPTTTPATTVGDGSSDEATTSSTDADQPADPADEAAMERAQSLNLIVEDFPSGWQNLPQAEAEVGVVELCTTVDMEEHLVATARSDAFSFTIEPGTLQASSAVTIFDDESAATDLLSDFRNDTFVGCATDTLRRDTDLYTITGELSRMETEPDLGDEAVALSGDFTITPTDGSPPHTLSAIVVAARKGDAVVTFNTTATDRGFEEETTRSLLTTIDERLEA